MSWEYKLLESLDYGHPGGSEPRFGEMADELTKLSNEGWEFVGMSPSYMRGRVTPGGKEETVSLTTIGFCVLLRKETDKK